LVDDDMLLPTNTYASDSAVNHSSSSGDHLLDSEMVSTSIEKVFVSVDNTSFTLVTPPNDSEMVFSKAASIFVSDVNPLEACFNAQSNLSIPHVSSAFDNYLLDKFDIRINELGEQ
jgi:hypothetical protein